MKLLLDMPNVVQRGLRQGKDPEYGVECQDPENPDKKVWVNGWMHGYENVLQMMSAALTKFGMTPKDMVMVFESDSPRQLRMRKAPKANYKGNRGKGPELAYVESRKADDAVKKFFGELGAAAVTQGGVEADDVLAYLALNAEEPVVVFSHDGDLMRLVGDNPKGFPVSVGNNDELNTNPYGPFPHNLITLYKGLVGDTNDNIKGARGFGDGAWLKVIGTYGLEGLYEVERLILRRELFLMNENVEECKVLKKIVEDPQGTYDSYTLARLYPEAIDTKSSPLRWTYGLVRDAAEGDDRRFKHWYGTRTLVDMKNAKEVITRAAATPTPFVALDLETTTPEESDDWLNERKKRESDSGIDVLGSEIVSCGMTYGDNLQHTIYLTHRHAAEPGVRQLTEQAMHWAIATVTAGKRVIAHNAGGFELPVLAGHYEFPGNWEGFLPDVHCTKILASYVNENIPSGLKPSARHYFGYEQQTFQQTTEFTHKVGEQPFPGGRIKSTLTRKEEVPPAVGSIVDMIIYDEDGRPCTVPVHIESPTTVEVEYQVREYKMDELPASHVFAYGTDDPWVTAGLYYHLRFRTQLEGAWQAYCDVEQRAMYLQAHAFRTGTRMSLEKMFELEAADDEIYDEAWSIVRGYLIECGWEGCVPPVFTEGITAPLIKQAFEIVTGQPLVTQVRTASKLATLVRAQGQDELADLIDLAIEGKIEPLQGFVHAHFNGEPQFNSNSPKQMQHLMYEVMQLPIRVRNKPTDAMRERGEREGTPKTDELAIEMALHYDNGGPRRDVVEALLKVKTVETRRKLYYVPYRHVQHWKTGLVHASFNQCSTVTRRYSCSGPNLQQQDDNIRHVMLPHHDNAVIVSMDFSGQELRLMAEESQDPAMLSCYVGDDLKDMHSLTGSGISRDATGKHVSYDELLRQVLEEEEAGVQLRSLGKKLNFTVTYGAMAKKVSLTLMVEEEVAQAMLEARAAVFAVSEKWKEDYIEQCRSAGYATTRLGARRHLAEAFESDDFMVSGKAERQGPNFKIQGSGAEMTKLAMGSMWDRRLFYRYDAVPLGPVHDEYVASVSIADLIPFLKDMHACMVQKYAGMKVPITSSISFGPSFGKQIKVGEQPTEQAINAALVKLRELRGEEVRLAA